MDLFDIVISGKINREGGGSAPVVEPLSVTENGVYTAPSGVDGYSPVTVDVQSGGGDVVLTCVDNNTFYATFNITDLSKVKSSIVRDASRVYFGEGITTVPAYFLYSGSHTVKLFDLPSTLTAINTGALNEVVANPFTCVCRAVTPPSNYGIQSSSSYVGTLYVPDESVEAYAAAINWKDFSQILPLSQYTPEP